MNIREILSAAATPAPSTRRDSRRILFGALIIYAIAVAFFCVRQAGYINSDFVAYAAIARELLHHPAASLSGIWSPLFSWLMSPLIYFGVSDLIAGRALLVLAGALYLVAVFWLITQFGPADSPPNSSLLTGVMACAVIQATLWSTYLLNPDILSAAFLFCYFALVVNSTRNLGRPFFAGLAAGLAFLAKAYNLPFVLLHFLATLLLRRGFTLRFVVLFLIGLTVIAAPWVSILSVRYQRMTFSNAGAYNHARFSPDNNDTLDSGWNPGLLPNYVIERLPGPNWSPFQDRAHLVHQMKLIAQNVGDGSIQVVGWLLFAVAGAVYWRIRVKRKAEPAMAEPARSLLLWCLVTIAIYAGGYTMVIVQPRYLEPVVAPLLCLIGLTFIGSQARSPNAALIPRYASIASGLLLVLPFAAQDGFRLGQVALSHPQSHRFAPSRAIAVQLQPTGALDQPMACNRWHRGLFVSYASDRISTYLGTPRPGAPEAMAKQLQNAGARCYLRWSDPHRDPASMTPIDRFIPPSPWKKTLVIKDPDLASREIEVYCISVDDRDLEPLQKHPTEMK